jgi:putative SOS response-associated peptidase YedK
LWDEWKDIETGVPLRSCTMIITTANDFVGKIHDRMPALLTPYQFDSWLSGDAGPESLRPWDQRSLQIVSGVADGEQLEGGGRRSDVD